ncbi:MAG: PilZ domain-containing protein [Deltaproteobacteria bacterium]|nr:PilZ domain-containing protein [Deltaproteobacteria bacterium]
MSYTGVLSGRTGLFTEFFRDTIVECGFELAIGEEGSFNISTEENSLSVIAVSAVEDLREIKPEGVRPFIIYSPEALPQEAVQALKDNGLLGVVTPETSPEDVAFLLNRALFYDKMLKRNPRVPVNLPVILTSANKVINSFASLLSRDGMFIVTLNPLEVNALCSLRFSLPDGGKDFSTGARVLYRVAINKELNIIANPRDPFKRMVSHPGMAVFFMDMSKDDRDEIDRYIETIL